MEKMLQSLLRLHCQTFLEKTYLRNSALNPGTVGRQGRVPAWLCGPVAGPSKCSRGDSIPDFQTGIFFPPKMAFSFRSRMFCAGKNTSTAFYSVCGVSAESGEATGPSMEIPTSFCNGRRRFSCCFLTVSPVAGLSAGRMVFWGCFKEKRNP